MTVICNLCALVILFLVSETKKSKLYHWEDDCPR